MTFAWSFFLSVCQAYYCCSAVQIICILFVGGAIILETKIKKIVKVCISVNRKPIGVSPAIWSHR